MQILKYATAALCLTTACAAFAANGRQAPIEVENGWVRWLPGDLPAAGYLTISNHGGQPVALVKESSPDYEKVMLHRSVTAHGSERMEMVERLPVPAHGKAAMSPGNYHLMLMHARHPIAPGDEIHVTLRFSDGSTVNAALQVRPANQLK